ncbi:S53 family peptidase [Clostridium ganghwense]|uniref:S53 family peptidase n=1 Tax=Clostridium ganghwense TaxID=312089 RepID=A0ABT4CRR7_9CLOT|nr:S53 family peptidase [Clostridium ganghwense]MCY6371737.1 S53 family peptidase [Clostridium ganghwense]
MIQKENNREYNRIQKEKDIGNNIYAHPFYLINKKITSSLKGYNPLQIKTLPFTGYHPSQIKKAYYFDKCFIGQGQTVAIITAFDHPNIENDLCVFSNMFNLPKANITIAYPDGRPPVDPLWALETSLDVEWIHTLAPRAKILLVAAKSNTFTNLFSAIDYAVKQGVQVVSMSWGREEFYGEWVFDYHFQHEGTVFVAGSGDAGMPLYPAASPYVLAVGGTSLQLSKNGKRICPEVAWSGSGGGISPFVPEPYWQIIFGITNQNQKRGIPDVSFLADPKTGVWIYISIPFHGYVGWIVLGGTSFSAPAWAAVIACAGQGYGPITNCSERLYTIAGKTSYSIPQYNFCDITKGSNGFHRASKGYDYVTGLGSPIVYRLIRKLRCLK